MMDSRKKFAVNPEWVKQEFLTKKDHE